MPADKEVNRREFIGAGSAGLLAVGGAGMLVRPERVLGANDRVRVAICGLHGRGLNHLQNYSQIHNAEVAALCDIDENVLRQRVAQMQKMGMAKPATYVDIRKLPEDHSIDSLSPLPRQTTGTR